MSDLKTQPPATQKQKDQVSVSSAVWFAVGLIPTLIFYSGAAKLSYDRFRSIGWAILAFLFAPIYYMYYAFFVSTSATPMMIAAARRASRM